MPTTPITQRRTLIKNQKFIFFNDDDITLHANIEFKADSISVDNIAFHLKNEGTKKYSFCRVLKCPIPSIPGTKTKKVIIHLNEGSDSKLSIVATEKDLGEIVFDNNNPKCEFRFKIYPGFCPKFEDHDNHEYTCDLSSATPKTKDGTIVESI